MFNFWDDAQDAPPPPARSAIFVMRNGRYEPQNLMPVLPRPDALDFDGFVVRRGANAGYMNPRPPEMRQAMLLKNPASLRRDTVRLLSAEEGSDGIVFRFTYDALRAGSISVHAMVREVEVTSGGVEKKEEAGEPKSPTPGGGDSPAAPSEGRPSVSERRLELRPQSDVTEGSQAPALQALEVKHFQEGLGQVFTTQPIKLEQWPDTSLAFDHDRPKDIPVAIVLEAAHMEGEEMNLQYTYLAFQRVPTSPSSDSQQADNRPQWSVQVFAQKLQYGSQCFVLHEVFGASKRLQEAEVDGGNSECVICLSEPRDTAVLPCRHMCFCSYCAGIVRLQCDRCPVCRQKVASLLQFRKDAPPQPISTGPGAAAASAPEGGASEAAEGAGGSQPAAAKAATQPSSP